MQPPDVITEQAKREAAHVDRTADGAASMVVHGGAWCSHWMQMQGCTTVWTGGMQTPRAQDTIRDPHTAHSQQSECFVSLRAAAAAPVTIAVVHWVWFRILP
ncbi:hypothetical protein ANO11243_013790 [Dothideomycetidae sp. 11243]|nr:hypothetical protein ANO11243_013790 [fungal sp. No.11243]